MHLENWRTGSVVKILVSFKKYSSISKTARLNACTQMHKLEIVNKRTSSTNTHTQKHIQANIIRNCEKSVMFHNSKKGKYCSLVAREWHLRPMK